MKAHIAVLAIAVLLAACESATDSSSRSTGNGFGTSQQPTAPGQGAPQGLAGIQGGTQQDLTTNVGDRVFFETNQSTLTSEGLATLNRQAVWLKRYPAVMLTIEGHCDERGTREYNLALGDRRANAAKAYLVAQGISAARLKIVSYGKERPVAAEASETAWSQNRRAVSVVQGPAGS